MEYKNPALTVDCVVFNEDGELLLIQRKNEPFKGKYALPGGFVDYGETVEHAAVRELKEETGVEAQDLKIVGVYSDPDRDPRGHVVSVAYLIQFLVGAVARAGDDAATAQFVKNWRELDFAFDHKKILEDAMKIA
jgi:8-oxo-dGTP diphosphatase